MNSQPSALNGVEAEGDRFGALLAQLRALRSAGLRDYWPVYGVGICTAVVAASDGSGFFALYAGVLAIVCMLHDRSTRRIDREIDAVLDTVRKLQDAKQDRT
jgi:hypothetical protein